MKLNRKKNAIRNAVWGNISKVISLLMPFIFRTVIIYKLGSEYVGLNSLFNSILQVLNLSELGIGTAIVFNMYKPIANNDINHINALLNLYKKLYTKIGFFIFLIGIAITPFVGLFIKGNYPNDINIYIVYFAFLLNTVISYLLYGYRSSLINAYQRNDIESKINSIVNLFLYSFSSILIITLKNYYYYLIVLIISTILNNVILSIITNKMYPDIKCKGNITNDEMIVIKKNVTALICHKVGATILNSADNIVISSFLGLAMLTKYTNYYYLMHALTTLIFVCFSGLTGGIGNSFETENKSKNSNDFNKILFFNGYLVIIFGTVLFSVYQTFIELWLGKDFMFPNGIVLLFIVYFYIHTIRRTIIVFRDGAGMWWENRFQPLISAVLNLVLNIILVQFIGVYGILLSTIIAMTIIDIPMESKVFCDNKVYMSMKEYILIIIKYFIILIISCFICFIINNFININIYFKLIFEGIISIIISNLGVYIIFKNQYEYRYYLDIIKTYIRKIKNKH